LLVKRYFELDIFLSLALLCLNRLLFSPKRSIAVQVAPLSWLYILFYQVILLLPEHEQSGPSPHTLYIYLGNSLQVGFAAISL